MNLYRVGQVIGVIMAGLGVGLLFAVPEASGGLWTVGGLMLYALARLIPWVRERD